MSYQEKLELTPKQINFLKEKHTISEQETIEYFYNEHHTIAIKNAGVVYFWKEYIKENQRRIDVEMIQIANKENEYKAVCKCTIYQNNSLQTQTDYATATKTSAPSQYLEDTASTRAIKRCMIKEMNLSYLTESELHGNKEVNGNAKQETEEEVKQVSVEDVKKERREKAFKIFQEFKVQENIMQNVVKEFESKYFNFDIFSPIFATNQLFEIILKKLRDFLVAINKTAKQLKSESKLYDEFFKKSDWRNKEIIEYTKIEYKIQKPDVTIDEFAQSYWTNILKDSEIEFSSSDFKIKTKIEQKILMYFENLGINLKEKLKELKENSKKKELSNE